MIATARRLWWNVFALRHRMEERRLPYRPLAELRRLQSRRVGDIVAHAYATVPHYREALDRLDATPADFRNASDLARLPLISGADLRNRPERFRSHSACSEDGLTIRSSGTGGRPKDVRYDACALFLALAHGERQRLVQAHFIGRLGGHRELIVVRPGSVRVQMRQFYAHRTWVPRGFDAHRRIVPPSTSFSGVCAELEAFRPDVLFGYGSWLGAFFRWAWDRGPALRVPRLVMYGADRMEPAERTLIEERFGVPVVSTYQAVEALRIGFQCERRGGFHLSMDHTAVRVVDENGRDLPAGGRGHLIISNLVNRATVLLNYRLGDVVTVGARPCPCGRTLPIISDIAGRSDDLIRRADGEAVHGLAVLDPLRTVGGVCAVQLVQESLTRLRIRAVPEDGVCRERAEAELATTVSRTLGSEVRATVQWVDSLETGNTGKVRAVISRVAPDSGE